MMAIELLEQLRNSDGNSGIAYGVHDEASNPIR